MKKINLLSKKGKVLFHIKESTEFHLYPNCLENISIKKEIGLNFVKSDTKSRIIFKCLAKKNVDLQLTFKLFSEEKDIEEVESYLEVEILNLFDNSIRIDPFLEISQKDIKFEHKVSIGSINEDWLSYLMSKGLSEKEATNLITQKYLNS
jgi:Fe-S cluster assembly scaffold protein SufB